MQSVSNDALPSYILKIPATGSFLSETKEKNLAIQQEGGKKKVLYVTCIFWIGPPFAPPPPTPPSSAPTQTKGVPICSSLNSAFICILRLVKFKGREMLRAKRETKMLDGAVWI